VQWDETTIADTVELAKLLPPLNKQPCIFAGLIEFTLDDRYVSDVMIGIKAA
jgi:hypothetical protein